MAGRLLNRVEACELLRTACEITGADSPAEAEASWRQWPRLALAKVALAEISTMVMCTRHRMSRAIALGKTENRMMPQE